MLCGGLQKTNLSIEIKITFFNRIQQLIFLHPVNVTKQLQLIIVFPGEIECGCLGLSVTGSLESNVTIQRMMAIIVIKYVVK